MPDVCVPLLMSTVYQSRMAFLPAVKCFSSWTCYLVAAHISLHEEMSAADKGDFHFADQVSRPSKDEKTSLALHDNPLRLPFTAAI